MGELLGIPEWLAETLFVLGGLSIWLVVGVIAHRRGLRRLAAKRPNPSREEFVAMLADAADAEVAAWLWDTALPYYKPLTPHPDDHLLEDAMIDDDDIAMDWCRDFARVSGLEGKAWPDWPNEWAPTVRNYACWLQLFRDR